MLKPENPGAGHLRTNRAPKRNGTVEPSAKAAWCGTRTAAAERAQPASDAAGRRAADAASHTLWEIFGLETGPRMLRMLTWTLAVTVHGM
mgnify:CR=1 FL=1